MEEDVQLLRPAASLDVAPPRLYIEVVMADAMTPEDRVPYPAIVHPAPAKMVANGVGLAHRVPVLVHASMDPDLHPRRPMPFEEPDPGAVPGLVGHGPGKVGDSVRMDDLAELARGLGPGPRVGMALLALPPADEQDTRLAVVVTERRARTHKQADNDYGN